MQLRSTSSLKPCEYCGKPTANIFPIMDKYVRACDGVHAYKAHRQECLINSIFDGAVARARMGIKSIMQSGQGLVEYALILVLVAVVVTIALALLGPSIGNVFSGIVANI